MPKKLEEVKKGLDCCLKFSQFEDFCGDCPFLTIGCIGMLRQDTMYHIEALEAKVRQYKKNQAELMQELETAKKIEKRTDKCEGCIFEGKAMRCAGLELRWAWYELLKSLPLVNRFAKEPEPCAMREEWPDE